MYMLAVPVGSLEMLDLLGWMQQKGLQHLTQRAATAHTHANLPVQGR